MSITTELPQHHDIPVAGGSIHALEVGDPGADPVVLLHGWPECAAAWTDVMREAAPTHRVIAFDLPGIGRSRLDEANGEKVHLAGLIHEAIQSLGLDDSRLTLVGQDAGGMIAFAYLRTQPAPRRAVIMDTAIPGVAPWDSVLANPYIWHFAFHSIPRLPETLVADHTAEYFDFFFEAITAHPERITPEQRARHVAAHACPKALTQGFAFYRAFGADAEANGEHRTVDTPLLYLRGSAEGGDLDEYADGFRATGVTTVTTGRIEDAGHFAPEEQPERVWAAIAAHIVA